MLAVSSHLARGATAQVGFQVRNWGNNNLRQLDMPTNLGSISQVSCGAGHTCALRSDGTLVGWGWNSYGQASVPVGLTSVTSVACGGTHTYALKSDGTLVGWGYNSFGQTETPQRLPSVSQVACGKYHTYAVTNMGAPVGWGQNQHGQIGTPAGLASVARIACGGYHTYALRSDGTPVGWGYNWARQTDTPNGLADITQVACGGAHSYALRSNGTLVGWGYNEYGQTNTPTDLFGVEQVACGDAHTYALKRDGVLVGWGLSADGRTRNPEYLFNVTQIACGDAHNSAIRAWSDCNQNGIFDGDDIIVGGMMDVDTNGVPDMCQGAIQYLRDSGNLGAPDPVAPASFTFTDLVPAEADVSLLITALGDFDAPNEYLTVRVSDPIAPLGSQSLGRLFESGGRNCSTGDNKGSVVVPKDLFNRLAQTGSITVTLAPNPPVTKGECPNGSMRVLLSYLSISPESDCDNDGRLDLRQITENRGLDSNLDGHLDGCSFTRGDLDLSGAVDTADLSVLLLSMGDSGSPPGDFDGDGVITNADLSMLLLHFGPITWP